MSKVALYFKRWKNYSRHKNLGEEWALATKLTDLSENPDDVENECEASDLEIFQVKFLGSTIVDSPKSEQGTANAIKSIIVAAKTSNKKLQRINLSVCPKGIETFDAVTGETLHQVSIYKISYCSADAAHNNIFAFIGGTGLGSAIIDPSNDNNDTLTCYAFVCAKRKIAHNLTLTVAKNFQRAYELWKKSEQRKTYRCETQRLNQQQNTQTLVSNKSHSLIHENDNRTNPAGVSSEDTLRNLLIDFTTDAKTSASVERQRQLLQNTWVSFDDEPQMCENEQSTTGILLENNLWEKNLICS